MMNKNLGYIHFGLPICNTGCFPMHFLGLAGLLEYYSNTAFPMFDGLSDINDIITFFALAGAIVQVIFIFFVYSILKG